MVSVLLAYFRTARVQIAALVYFLIAGSLTQIPLFNYLGYEFSALMTVPAALISGILTIRFMREHRMKPLTRRTWLYVIIDYLIVNGLLLIIPIIVISLNAFAIKNCAYMKGLAYYLLLPAGAMVFSVALALIVGLLFRRAVIAWCFVVMAILSHILFVTYTQPQLFAYNFILGFFPGITYDETLSDMTPLIIFRQFTVIVSIMFISLFVILTGAFDRNDTISNNVKFIKRNFPQDKVLLGAVILCLLTAGAGHLWRDVFGFEYSEHDIQTSLGRRTESDHFIFYYAVNDYLVEEIRRIKAESEFHYRKAEEILRSKNSAAKKIAVYVYPNAEWKQRYIGTSSTNIAKPWKREIHLTKSSLEATFRHELVHILASDHGFPVINASTRMGLNEGLAVAVDWDEGMFTPHQFAAALQRENGLENAERLFSFTGFAVQSSSYAYLVSGSFVRYLVERFGIERFYQAYPNGNFVRSFGESLESLVKDWKAFLKTIDATELQGETVKALFFQQSIFYKTCPREVAEQNRSAVQAMRTKDFLRAESEFNASYSNAPTAYALRGIFQSLNSQQRPADVIRKYFDLPASSPFRTNPAVQLLLADAYYLDRKQDSAKGLYRSIRDLNYSASYIEATVLRIQCVNDGIDPSVFHSLYYAGLEDTKKVGILDSIFSKNQSSVALQYMRAMLSERMLTGRAELFKKVVERTSFPELKYFASVRSAHQSYLLRKFEEAKSMYWQAKNYAPTSTLSDRLDENIELCDFISLELQ